MLDDWTDPWDDNVAPQVDEDFGTIADREYARPKDDLVTDYGADIDPETGEILTPETALTLFSQDDDVYLAECKAHIEEYARATAEGIWHIGEWLAKAQERLANYHEGKFVAWLENDLGWAHRTAYNYIGVYKTFSFATVAKLKTPLTVLYQITAAPDSEERDALIARVEAGELVDKQIVVQAVSMYRSVVHEVNEERDTTGGFITLPDGEQVQANADSFEKAADGAFGERIMRKKVHVSLNSGNNEWYTPAEYIEAARRVMGSIDLDPASSVLANQVVRATRIYTAIEDGLRQNWRGTVWLNPPYAAELIGKFCGKLREHVDMGHVSQAIVLVNNATETAWFLDLVSVANAIVFPNTRVRFLKANGETGAPLQGQAVINIGTSASKFIDEFSKFGWSARL